MGGRICDDSQADVQLWVNAPISGSQKDESQAEKLERIEELKSWVAELKKALHSGAPIALCDVAFPNAPIIC